MDFAEFKYALGDIFIDEIENETNINMSDFGAYYDLKVYYPGIRSEARAIYISKRLEGMIPLDAFTSTLDVCKKIESYWTKLDEDDDFCGYDDDFYEKDIILELGALYKHIDIFRTDFIRSSSDSSLKEKYSYIFDIIDNLWGLIYESEREHKIKFPDSIMLYRTITYYNQYLPPCYIEDTPSQSKLKYIEIKTNCDLKKLGLKNLNNILDGKDELTDEQLRLISEKTGINI